MQEEAANLTELNFLRDPRYFHGISLESIWISLKAEKDVKALDINGDARVERHEIKQMVKLSTPEADRQRAEYLAEIGKFKDMVRDCSRDRSVSSGQISIEEGMECLRKFVSFLRVFISGFQLQS